MNNLSLSKRLSVLTTLAIALVFVASSNFSTRVNAMPSCGGNDPSAWYDAQLAICLATCAPGDAICYSACFLQNNDLASTTPCDTGGNNFGGLGGTFAGGDAGAGNNTGTVQQCTWNASSQSYNCQVAFPSNTPTPTPTPGATPYPPATNCPSGSVTTLGTCQPSPIGIPRGPGY